MNKLLLITIMIFTSLNIIKAQSGAGKPPKQWWLQNSFADTVQGFLYHAEARYNYTKMTGNIAGEIQSGQVSAAVRRSIVTLNAIYFLDKTDIALKNFGMSYVSKSQTFTGYADVDLNAFLFCEGGFIWERDNMLYLRNRYTLYAGLGFNGNIHQKHYLKVLLAVGNIDQDYTIPVDNLDVIKGAHSAFYIRQHYKFIMNPVLSLMEEAYYLNEIKYSNRYRLGVIVNLNISVVKPVSLVLSYNYKFDKESELLGAVPTNTIESIGVMISL